MGVFDGAQENLNAIKDAVLCLERPLIEGLGHSFEPIDKPIIDKRWDKRKNLWYLTNAPDHVRMECHNEAIRQYRPNWEKLETSGMLDGMLKKRVLQMLDESSYTERDIRAAKEMV